MAVGAVRGDHQPRVGGEGLRHRFRADAPRRPHPDRGRHGRVDDLARLPARPRPARRPGHPHDRRPGHLAGRRWPGLVGRGVRAQRARRHRALARRRRGPATGLRAALSAHRVAGLRRRCVHRHHRAGRGDGAARGGAPRRAGVRGRRPSPVPDPGADGGERRYAEAGASRDPRRWSRPGRRGRGPRRRARHRGRLGAAAGRAALLRHLARPVRPDLVAPAVRRGVRDAECVPGRRGPGVPGLAPGRGGRAGRPTRGPPAEPAVAVARPAPAGRRHRHVRGRGDRSGRRQRDHRRWCGGVRARHDPGGPGRGGRAGPPRPTAAARGPVRRPRRRPSPHPHRARRGGRGRDRGRRGGAGHRQLQRRSRVGGDLHPAGGVGDGHTHGVRPGRRLGEVRGRRAPRGAGGGRHAGHVVRPVPGRHLHRPPGQAAGRQGLRHAPGEAGTDRSAACSPVPRCCVLANPAHEEDLGPARRVLDEGGVVVFTTAAGRG